MHHLDRRAAPPPPCLTRYAHGAQAWPDVLPEHREEIRKHLERLQGRRCAYCESSLDALGEHIEHFRNRHAFPKLTFEWNNLLWSCDQPGHSGKFKDNKSGPYNPDDLIDPSNDDPEHFFKFRPNGTIDLRTGLPETEQHRARETLRVLNLDQAFGPLRRMRYQACCGYVQSAIELAELAQASPPDDSVWREFRDAEIEATRDHPFATAIKHTLMPN